ncbi:BgTH12-01811 [Blumeria graminis f. sp. triticale]|uniref:BgTH12-01811 n=4 Tax=Blumeria graminis TaxID=34373 RepID=A0A9W4GF68_BLUGR|nr:BgTH12-01811 [Blumeria graminis f. sp. triticale]
MNSRSLLSPTLCLSRSTYSASGNSSNIHHRSNSNGNASTKSYTSNSSSASGSTNHARREDQLVATLTSLSMEANGGTIVAGGARKRNRTVMSGSASSVDPTGHKSSPIAIEFPAIARVYTPLTARGDLPGGYFPNHEQKDHRPRRIHGLSELSRAVHHYDPMDSPTFSKTIANSALLSPQAISPPVLSPEPLIMPTGKYYPSNYMCFNESNRPTPSKFLSPKNLSIPTIPKRGKERQSVHERKTPDVTRKLQQYQQEMLAQAKKAVKERGIITKKPQSITLRPIEAGPGGITPFELEGETNGYLTEGERR